MSIYINGGHRPLVEACPDAGTMRVVKMTIGQYVELVESGTIVPYIKTPNASTVEDIFQNFFPAALGSVTVARRSDGTFLMCDAHARTAAMIRRKNEDSMGPFEISSDVAVLVVPEADHLAVYHKMNSRASNKEKLANTAAGAGAYLQALFDESGCHFDQKHWLNLADAVLAYAKHDLNAPLERAILSEVFRARSKYTTPVLDGDISFEDLVQTHQRKEVVAGLRFVAAVMRSVQDNKSPSNDDHKKVLNSPGLWMYLLADFLSDKKVASQGARDTGIFIMSHSQKVIDYAKKIARRNLREISSSDLDTFDKILTCSYKGNERKRILEDARRKDKT